MYWHFLSLVIAENVVTQVIDHAELITVTFSFLINKGQNKHTEPRSAGKVSGQAVLLLLLLKDAEMNAHNTSFLLSVMHRELESKWKNLH